MNDSERRRWDEHLKRVQEEQCRPLDQPTVVEERRLKEVQAWNKEVEDARRLMNLQQPTVVGPQVPEEGWEGLPPVRPLEWVPGSLPLHPAPSAESMIKKGEALAAQRQAELLDGGLVKGVVLCVNGMATYDPEALRQAVRVFYEACGCPGVNVLVLSDVDQYREVR